MGEITAKQVRGYKGPWEAYMYLPDRKEVIVLKGHHSECIDALYAALMKVHNRAIASSTLTYKMHGKEAEELVKYLATAGYEQVRCFWRVAYGATWGVRIPRDVVELWLRK